MRVRFCLRRARRLGLSALLAITLLPAQQAAAEVTDDPRPAGTYADDKVLVRFADNMPAAEVDKILDDNDLVQEHDLPVAGVGVFRITDGTKPERVIKDLRRRGVALAEPDYDLKPAAISNDPSVGQLWGLENTGQVVNGQSGIANVDINAPAAWNTSKGDGVLVAVIDEGVDISHPEFAGRIWQNDDCYNDGVDHDNNGYVNDCNGWDFFNRDSSIYDPIDGDDHGTHVAGTIVANIDNAAGIAGVAPGAKIMPLKFLGPNGGSTSDAILAIQYAKANGARIVNCSWGGTAFSQALKDAIANSGMMFAVAAGNDGNNITSTPEYPAAFDLPNMVTVAAVDNRGNLASYSNYGGSTDVGAPGSSVYSTMPKPPAAPVIVDNSPAIGTYRTSFWGFGLEDVVGANVRRDLIAAEMTRLGATSGSPIVIVDDDESVSGSLANTNGYYSAALAAAGFHNVSTIEVTHTQNGPSAATLAGKFVIWQTGYAVGSTGVFTLTGTDLSNLDAFLNGGGRLVMAGADAIWRNESSSFVKTKLGIEVAGEGDARTAASGVVGSALEGMSISLAGTESPYGSPNEYKDSVKPVVASARNALVLDEASSWNTAYGYKNGTSMATPHVAGVAALIAAKLPSASAVEIANRVLGSVRPLASLNNKTTTGGMVDAAVAMANLSSAPATPPGDATPEVTAAPAASGGYRFVASDGGIFSYGSASFQGSTGGQKLNQPVVGMATTPSNDGYWLVARDGGIFGFNAPFHGSAGALTLNQPIVGMAATPTGNGYWLVASDGGIFSYGDAAFYGSTGAIKLNQPIVGMAATPSGKGYWLVARDGGIFSYGDAAFYGSTGAISLNKPIVGMASTPTGKGYWLVASDGGIFSYGDAGFRGSAGALKLNSPVVGIASTKTGLGYWLVAADGGIFSYGDAGFFGSTGAIKLNQPIVSMSR